MDHEPELHAELEGTIGEIARLDANGLHAFVRALNVNTAGGLVPATGDSLGPVRLREVLVARHQPRLDQQLDQRAQGLHLAL